MKYILLVCYLVLANLIYSDALPDTMPEDIQIRYYKSLGHAGRGFSLELSSKNSKYIDKFIQKENEISFTLPPEELTAIYQTLLKNKLHKIQYTEGLIHDYDGVSLSVSWKGGSLDVSQSGRKIKSNWEKEWANVITPLEKIMEREIKNAQGELQLNLDKSLLNSFIHIQFDSPGFVFRKYVDANLLKENSIKVKTLPGVISIYCILYKGYDIKKREEIYSDFDPERASIWDNKHNEYLSSLKQESFPLKLDFKTKKTFQLIRKGDTLLIK